MDIPTYLMAKAGGGGGKGALKVVIVDELPETGEANILYLVPRQISETNNVFDEYLYIEDDWEKVGTTDIDISGKQDTFQYSTMPTASADYVGKIFQYTGTTNANYTNGYFYICLSDGQATPTYSWTNINVQENKSLVAGEYLKVYAYRYTTSSEFYTFLGKIITDAVANNCTPYLLLDGTNTDFNKTVLLNPGSTWNYQQSTYYYFSSGGDIKSYGSSGNSKFTSFGVNCTWSNNVCTVTYINMGSYNIQYALSTTNTTSYTPTGDYNPATKKYVDDAVAGAGGGSASEITIDIQQASQTSVLEEVSNLITNNIDKVVKVYVKDGAMFSSEGYINVSNLVNSYTPTASFEGNYGTSYDTVTISGSWNAGRTEFTASSITSASLATNKALSVDNASAYIPTQQYHPATKSYVDNGVDGVRVQVMTMPTASADNLGKIVQYTGADTQDYTNGYFYQVVSDGETPATYSWEQLDVQPSSGGFDEYYPDIISLKTGDTSNETISKIENTINRLISQGKRNFYVLLSGQVYGWAGTDIGLILTGRIYDTADPNPTGSPKTSIDCTYFGGMPLERRANIAKLTIYGTWDANLQYYTVSSINYGYNGTASYTFVDTNNSTAYTPSNPYNPSTKLYVDLLKANAAGFVNVYQRNATYAVDDKVYVIEYSSTQKGNPRYFICNTAHTTTDNYIAQDIANWDEYFLTQDELLLANKKYVDDLVGNINTILATLTTPSNNGGN